jgi:TatD DNase family protein
MRYFDAHCHIQFAPYDEDREAVIAAMHDAEVGGIIVGTDSDSSKKAIELADGETLFASVGLHPNDKPQEGYDDAYYAELAKDSKVVAIGECGLDYFRPENPEAEKARQKDVFARHIKLAGEIGKPLMIHARPSKGSMDAYEDAYDLLVEAKKEFPNLAMNMHFYVGDVAMTEKLLTLGATFSYTAVLTFTSDYDEVVRSIPLTNLLTETDAPYVAPAPNRGKRNVPLAVRDVVTAIARIRGEEEEVIRTAVLENATRVFSV